jgi:hypothetical protein
VLSYVIIYAKIQNFFIIPLKIIFVITRNNKLMQQEQELAPLGVQMM